MNFYVIRDTFTEISCIGKFFIENEMLCNTLEDKMREVIGKPVKSWKVDTKTAIPCGTYEVILDFSNRFHKTMPHILGVPGFTGIRIHGGNHATDTDGCIMVGKVRYKDTIAECHDVYEEIVNTLSECAKNKEKVYITVSNKESV